MATADPTQTCRARSGWPAWIAAVGGVFWYLLFLLNDRYAGVPIRLESGDACFLIPDPWRLYALLAVSLAWPAWTLHPACRTASPLAPMAWLPFAFSLHAIGSLSGGRFGAVVNFWLSLAAANTLFFTPVVVGTVVVSRLSGMSWPRLAGARPATFAALVFFGMGCFYTLTGWRINDRIGEHSVDEGHYLAQAASLYADGDLNIRNNLGFDVDRLVEERLRAWSVPPDQAERVRAEEIRKIRRHMHVSPRSPEDRWYSWHPFGVALFLAPFEGLGGFGRSLALGFIASAGLAAILLICLAQGRSRGWSLAAVVLFGLTAYWYAFAIRALPEALGASLFCVALYAGYLAKRLPVRAFFLLAACGVLMLLAQARFAPCAIAAGIFFLARVFFVYATPPRARRFILGLLIVAVALGVAFIAINLILYKHITSYPSFGFLWVYPEGAWLVLFSERGLVYGLPAFCILFAGLWTALRNDRNERGYHMTLGATWVVLLAVLGTADNWDGGPTMAGRYLLVGVPPLIPGAVLLVERASSLGRRWWIFLWLYSAMFTAMFLRYFGGVLDAWLHKPLQSIRFRTPNFRELLEPYFTSDIMIGHPYRGWELITANPFPWLLLVVTVFVLRSRDSGLRAWTARVSLVGLLLLATGLHRSFRAEAEPWSPDFIERVLADGSFAHARFVCGGVDAPIHPHANRLHTFQPVELTARDLGQPRVAGVYSQPRLGENDWAGRGYRWFTVVDPFNPGHPGLRRIGMEGRLEAGQPAHLVVKHGADVVLEREVRSDPEGRFSVVEWFDIPRNRGDVYILLRLEDGEATIRVDRLEWTAVPDQERDPGSP